jgi:hypothetical protein
MVALAGEYNDGVYEGQGVFTYEDGSEYDGAWYDGKHHGHGVFRGRGWPDAGRKYEGAYEHGVRQGLGKYTLHNGATFTGAFVNGTAGKGDWAFQLTAGHLRAFYAKHDPSKVEE